MVKLRNRSSAQVEFEAHIFAWQQLQTLYRIRPTMDTTKYPGAYIVWTTIERPYRIYV